MTTELSPRPATGLGRFFDRDPFRSLQHQMDDLMASFSREWDGSHWLSTEFHPSIDVSETDDAIEIRVDLPGIKPEEVDVEVRGNLLQITGERKEEREEKGKTWHRTERHVGKFARTMTLPCDVQDNEVEAECCEGVLRITLPKAEQARTHKIPVRAK
ncbi:MAG: Hsp20/alpha crystallin family protein [Planctomycetaceae bacterium]|jgi:HSP20 family protein|nr:Hsp20/alpha crystallin family protein [Planctomycetaceae bacterium]MBT6493219.1 Hsp20/alpha crystallin family protein [Planctomycetaceae bacterium]